MAIFLELTRPHELSVQQDRSIPLSVAELKEAINQKKKQSKEDRDIHDNIEDLLEKLASDTSELMSRVGEGPGGSIYCVNIKRIMDIARSKLVEAVVKDRFGVQGISLT